MSGSQISSHAKKSGFASGKGSKTHDVNLSAKNNITWAGIAQIAKDQSSAAGLQLSDIKQGGLSSSQTVAK